MEQTKIYKYRKYIELCICNDCFLPCMWKNTAYNQSVAVNRAVTCFWIHYVHDSVALLTQVSMVSFIQEFCLYDQLGQKDDGSSYGKRKL